MYRNFKGLQNVTFPFPSFFQIGKRGANFTYDFRKALPFHVTIAERGFSSITLCKQSKSKGSSVYFHH